MQTAARTSTQPPLRIVARDGQRVVDHVPVSNVPETRLLVSFSGITVEEQRAALEAFPGGRRFILVREAS
jgi:hypothetical protein